MTFYQDMNGHPMAELLVSLRSHDQDDRVPAFNEVAQLLQELSFLRQLGLEADDIDQRGVGIFTALIEVLRERDRLTERLNSLDGPRRVCPFCSRDMQGSRAAVYTVNGYVRSAFQCNEIGYRCANEDCVGYGDMEIWTNTPLPQLRYRFPAEPGGAPPGEAREHEIRLAFDALSDALEVQGWAEMSDEQIALVKRVRSYYGGPPEAPGWVLLNDQEIWEILNELWGDMQRRGVEGDDDDGLLRAHLLPDDNQRIVVMSVTLAGAVRKLAERYWQIVGVREAEPA